MSSWLGRCRRLGDLAFLSPACVTLRTLSDFKLLQSSLKITSWTNLPFLTVKWLEDDDCCLATSNHLKWLNKWLQTVLRLSQKKSDSRRAPSRLYFYWFEEREVSGVYLFKNNVYETVWKYIWYIRVRGALEEPCLSLSSRLYLVAVRFTFSLCPCSSEKKMKYKKTSFSFQSLLGASLSFPKTM